MDNADSDSDLESFSESSESSEVEEEVRVLRQQFIFY